MTIRMKGRQFQADFMFNGRRFRRSFSSVVAAEVWELRAKADAMEGRVVSDDCATVVVPVKPLASGGGGCAGILDFVAHVKKVWWDKKGRRSASKLARNAEMFAEFVGPSVPVSEALTHAQVDRYTDHMTSARHNSNETINRHLASIRVLMRIARRENKIPEMFLLDSFSRSTPRERVVSVAEEQALLAYLERTGRLTEIAYIVFLLDTGGRRGETHALTWESVDWTAGKVTFKGATTKSGKGRNVWLSDRVKARLEGLRRDPQYGAHTTVFGGLNYHGVSAWWQGLRTHLPFLADANLHDLRHTCATRLASKGFDAFRLKDWMGHSSIVTSERYVNLTLDHLRSGRDIINSFGGGDDETFRALAFRGGQSTRNPSDTTRVFPHDVCEPQSV